MPLTSLIQLLSAPAMVHMCLGPPCDLYLVRAVDCLWSLAGMEVTGLGIHFSHSPCLEGGSQTLRERLGHLSPALAVLPLLTYFLYLGG